MVFFITIKHHVEIINKFKDTFIEMHIGVVSDEKINEVTNKYESLLK